MYLSIMMIVCTKQNLGNIWSTNHEKGKQHWGWVEKSVAYKKACKLEIKKNQTTLNTEMTTFGNPEQETWNTNG